MENLENTLKELMLEFEISGMGIDDFVKSKLASSGRIDAAKCAEEIISTLTAIDEKFVSLQKMKADGYNREEWLRSEVDEAVAELSPEQAGELLASATDTLNNADEPTPSAPYSALDAAFIIRDLDDALVKNSCDNLAEEK